MTSTITVLVFSMAKYCTQNSKSNMKLVPSRACETEKNRKTQEIERTQCCKVTFSVAECPRTWQDSYVQILLKGLVMLAWNCAVCWHCWSWRTPRNGPMVTAWACSHGRQLLALCDLVPTQFLCLNFHCLSFLTELSPRRMIYVY